MVDDQCVYINNEISDALSSMNNGLFQGMNFSSQNPWTMGFAALLLVMFLVVTFAQIRQRQKITTEKQAMNIPTNRNTEIQQLIHLNIFKLNSTLIIVIKEIFQEKNFNFGIFHF